MQPTDNKVPNHIGLILDGNRRFAKRLMLKPFKGHEWGAKKVKELLEWSRDLGIKELTLYAFSIENFHRPKKEFDYLMNLFEKEFKELIKNQKEIHKHKLRINFIGRIEMFPEPVHKAMKQLMEITKDHNGYIVNFAMAYGGKAEIIDATKKIATQIKEGKLNIDQINEEIFSQNLYMADEPDMIIRTGGEKRSSNFLNFQSAYSEWFYLEKKWPEFTKEDYIQCIEEYGNRERRFGSYADSNFKTKKI